MSLLALIDEALADQRDLTAVERFSNRHDAGLLPEAGRWRDLLPASAPGPGEQYGFEVDLDACTGCKACVTACRSLNGLDDDESWRTVGLLHGPGAGGAPVLQHVTATCHHCLDPACLSGCPVDAYEKDPVTGIVAHLDDQCIGCGYCTFNCPYDVPRYYPSRGIVRKCVMCAGRLAEGEAPD
ncbi:MAG: 4Fe-4S dicluster domain-containing protein, partial [Acidimicrobiia bacterium]